MGLGIEEEKLKSGDAEYVRPREETHQYEVLIEIDGKDATLDTVEAYFTGRREHEALEKSQRGGHLLAEDEKDAKKVYYMFKEQRKKVELSFRYMTDDEALVVVNEVRKLVGLAVVDAIQKEPAKQ